MARRTFLRQAFLKGGGWLIFCLPLAAGGCDKGDIPFIDRANYALSGLEDDPDTERYVTDILQEKLRNETPGASSEGEAARDESYREEILRADIVKAMAAKGYYDAKVRYDDGATPLTGTYAVMPGARYRIVSVTVGPPAFSHFRPAADLAENEVLDAEKVLKAQNALYKAVQKDTCYFSLEIAHHVFLDDREKTAHLEFTVEAGPPAVFGPVSFTGQDSVKTSYLEKLVPFKPGDCYRRERIDALQAKIMETGLFARADANLPETVAPGGSAPVTMVLKERAQRTFRSGLSYYTDEGPGVMAGWEHRNFLGSAEKLDAELVVSQLKQSLDLNLTKPFFMRRDQSLSLFASLRSQDTDAFRETGADVGFSVNRSFGRHWRASGGGAFTLTEIDDETADDTDMFALFSAPAGLTYDDRDDALDPSKGWLLSATTAPFFDAFGESDPFLKTRLGASTYIGIGSRSRNGNAEGEGASRAPLTLALKAGAGSIVGADTQSVPATERFYAGGGSVRGFGYQEVGPFEDGDPVGGRSLVEMSTELRFRITDTIGAVTFVDGGSVSDASIPDLDNFSVGAGAGLRYFTGFGPLRFDVAVPLNNKDDLERNYQFYISIGQAF